MKKLSKKLLVMLLALVMVLSLSPMAAFAAETEENAQLPGDNYPQDTTGGIEAVPMYGGAESTDSASLMYETVPAFNVDMVFVVDTTGSMWDEINNLRLNLNRFTQIMGEDGFDYRIAVIDYKDITCREPTRLLERGGEHWFTTADDVAAVLGSVSVSGGGDDPETVVDALGMAMSDALDWREDGRTARFAVVLTDAGWKVNNNYGYSSMDDLIEALQEAGINTSVIAPTYYQSYYKDLVEGTDGLMLNIYASDFGEELEKLLKYMEIIVEPVKIELTSEQTRIADGKADYTLKATITGNDESYTTKDITVTFEPETKLEAFVSGTTREYKIPALNYRISREYEWLVSIDQGSESESYTWEVRAESSNFPVGAVAVKSDTFVVPALEVAANEYNVLFDANGGTLGDDQPLFKTVRYNSTYGELPEPTRSGYSFLGWYTAPTDGALVNASARFMAKADLTLYAHWLPVRGSYVTITFRTEAGDIQPYTKKDVIKGEPYGDLPNATRSGYVFDGWWTARSGGSRVTSETTVELKDDAEIWAHWQAVTTKAYTITFNPNGGSVAYEKKDIIPGGTYGDLPTAQMGGKIFNGWWTQENGGNLITATSPTGDLTGDQTLYAHWLDGTTESYTVTFDANGGNLVGGNATGTRQLMTGQVYGTFPTVVRAGYTLIGWFTAQNNGNQITEETVFDLSKNQTLYAHWDNNIHKETVTITFDANGGNIVGDSSKTIELGDTYGPLPTAQMPGKVLNGWWTSRNGGDRITENTSTGSLTGNQTLYAHWRDPSPDDNFTVTFDGVGGTIVGDNILQVTNGDKYQFPAVSKGGYTFVGWFTASSGGNQITEETVVSLTADQTLYAHWSRNATPYYIVTFDANAEDAEIRGSAETNVIPGQTYTYLPVAVRSGYRFLGWYTAKTGGVLIDESTTVTLTQNTTFYAQWKELAGQTYRVTYIANSGTISGNDWATFQNGEYYTFPLITRPGWTFLGWYTSRTGGTKITEDTIVDLTGDQTLYAQWKQGNYPTVTITFNAGDGVVIGFDQLTLTPGDKIGVLPTAVRQSDENGYYVLSGWYTTQSSSGTRLQEGYPYDGFTDTMVYARWEYIPIPTITVTFMAPSGSVINGSTRSVYYGEPYGNLPSASRAGYVFDGWYTSRTGGNLIEEDTIVNSANDHFLYARWRLPVDEPYTITFNPNGGRITNGNGSVQMQPNDQFVSLPTAERSGGYTFAGWYTQSVNGTLIRAGDLFQTSDFPNGGTSKNLTLFAQWNKPATTYTITLNPNGGDLDEEEATLELATGQKYGELPEPEGEDGWTFLGWYTKKTNGDLVDKNSTFLGTKKQTLYAHWDKVVTYTITFNPNGGQVDGDSTMKLATGEKYGKYGDLPEPEYGTREFLGWWTTKKTGGTQVTEATTFKGKKNTTLYARWGEPDTFTVTFDPGDGKLSTKYRTREVEKNAPYGELPEPTLKGYEFTGWYTKPEGGTVVTAKKKCTKDITLYARWEEDLTYTVTFDPGEGKLAARYRTREVEKNAPYGELPEPTLKNYEFIGWYTKAIGGTAINEKKKCTKDITLYAHWEEIKDDTFTVNFDAGEGRLSAANSTKEVTKGEKYGTLPTPTRSGYDFVGWYTKSVGGSRVAATSTFRGSADITLYAHWKAQQ